MGDKNNISPYRRQQSQEQPEYLLATDEDNNKDVCVLESQPPVAITGVDDRDSEPLSTGADIELSLKQLGVIGTVLFIGGGRALDQECSETRQAKLYNELEGLPEGPEKNAAARRLTRDARAQWACEYYDLVRKLSQKFTEWTMGNQCHEQIKRMYCSRESCNNPMNYKSEELLSHFSNEGYQPLMVITTGGQGMVEAANRGAADACESGQNGKSIGIFSDKPATPTAEPNGYITKDLRFRVSSPTERKFWCTFLVKGVVLAPGGIGTLEYLFDVLKMRESGKLDRSTPIILLGVSFWKAILNLNSLVASGMASEKDLSNLLLTDSMSLAFKFLTEGITKS